MFSLKINFQSNPNLRKNPKMLKEILDATFDFFFKSKKFNKTLFFYKYLEFFLINQKKNSKYLYKNKGLSNCLLLKNQILHLKFI